MAKEIQQFVRVPRWSYSACISFGSDRLGFSPKVCSTKKPQLSLRFSLPLCGPTWVRSLRSWTREGPLLQIANNALLRKSLFFIPGRKLKRAWLPPGMQKPTPIGVGFLLDVVPPGLEPGTT